MGVNAETMMGAWLGQIVFLHPWVLAGLAVLPVLWVLLRITPPAPKRVLLPTVRFLEGLIPAQQTPSKTPWWLLLLRLFIAALVLLALAGPVLNPADSLPGEGRVRIVLDNGWAAGTTWEAQVKAAEELLAQAAREEREVMVLTTADPRAPDVMSAAQAKAYIQSLSPLPWAEDYMAAQEFVSDAATSFFLSHGLDGRGLGGFAQRLQAAGYSVYYAPGDAAFPAVLRRDEKGGLHVESAGTPAGGRIFSVQALSSSGEVVDQRSVKWPENDEPAFEKSGEIAAFRIGGQRSAGGVYILDEQYTSRVTGIIGPPGDVAPTPFIEERYYLTRALEPYGEVVTGALNDVLAAEPAVIVLPDIAALPPQEIEALEAWVKSGGTLLRFAGPNMAKSGTGEFLVPAKLRLNARSMEGALTWETPASLTEFTAQGPFADLRISPGIHVNTQILAEPSEALEGKTWARLADGTPLITGAQLEKGLMIFVHTTASPAWSDLALSGTYVDILRRVVRISGRGIAGAAEQSGGSLQPLWVLNGFGRRQEPGPEVKPMMIAEYQNLAIDAAHPPGLYGMGNLQKAVNIGDKVPELAAARLPAGINKMEYGAAYEMAMMPFLLALALVLLLLDWLLMIVLYGNVRRLKWMACLPLLFFSTPSHAATDMDYADGFYLAYVRSGNSAVDATTQKGLENLAKTLNRRTSVETAGVAAINLEEDNLVFFPILYYPVVSAEQGLSVQALANLQSYLDHGGTILFDLRARGSQNLQTLVGGLNVPPLQPIPKDHVLKKTFYLLDDLQGRTSGDTFWVETSDGETTRDGVSSVMIGSHDWAAAWASDARGRNNEMALRFGVNLVMYALTGNYKEDQVHVPHILERMQQ